MNINTPYQYINPQGELVNPLPKWATDDRLVEFYCTLMLIRSFDKKAIALQRTGQLGTYPSCLGQEALSLGTGLAMTKEDVLSPYYRDQGALYARGFGLASQLQYWGGDERGSTYPDLQNSPYPAKDMPICIPIATQVTHAAGIASAFKIQGKKHAVVATCGEGATSRGEFYESLNLAGVWQLPMITVVNNNHWAISTPSSLQTNSTCIADKALAAGIEGITIDGNDICAVYQAVHLALNKAYQNKGPTLIEAMSYRLGDHTTADDATRYRSAEELNEAWKKDPIKRLQTYLVKKSLWNPDKEKELIYQHQQLIDKEVASYLAIKPASVTDCFDYLYDELPEAMLKQRAHCIQKANHNLQIGG